jgi:hypothetical protein
MRKVLIGAAILLGTSQASYAVEDQKILNAINAQIKTIPELCAHLETLPKEDKKRLQGLIYGDAQPGAQTEIKKLIDDSIELEACINYINTTGTAW